MADDREAKLSDLQVGVHVMMGEHRGWKRYDNCMPSLPWTADEIEQGGPLLRECSGPVWLSGLIVRPNDSWMMEPTYRANRIRIGSLTDPSGRKCSYAKPYFRTESSIIYEPGKTYFGAIDVDLTSRCAVGFHAWAPDPRK